MLKTLILSAAAAGVAAGLFTAVVQHVTTTPIIIEAEKYEGGAGGRHSHGAAVDLNAWSVVYDHVAPAMPRLQLVHSTNEAATDAAGKEWSPGDGIERTLYASLATTVVGVGFALALLGTMVLAGVRIDSRSGLAFGAAGFAAVALAPALGLPPEIPGSGAAALEARQIWWFATVAATAIGLAGLLLTRNMALQIGGVVLMALPHIVGAPHPDAYASTAPAELAGHFAATSLAVTAIFWAVLGFASGGFYERFARNA